MAHRLVRDRRSGMSEKAVTAVTAAVTAVTAAVSAATAVATVVTAAVEVIDALHSIRACASKACTQRGWPIPSGALHDCCLRYCPSGPRGAAPAKWPQVVQVAHLVHVIAIATR